MSRSSGRRAPVQTGGQVQKTFATIWRQTPRATGGNEAVYIGLGGRGVGRGKGVGNSERRGDGAVSVSIKCRYSGGFRVVQTARGGARRPDLRVVSTCFTPLQRTRDRGEAGTGASEVGAPRCACAAGQSSSSKSSPPAFSFHSDAITIANDARECYRERRLGTEPTEESSSSRARQGTKRTCVNKATPRFYRAGRRLTGRLLSASNVDGS